MSDDLKTALEDLIHAPGWLLFKEHARKEWGPEGYGRKVQTAIATKSGTAELAPAVEQIHATTREINELMKWPEQQLKKAAPKDVGPMPMQRVGR